MTGNRVDAGSVRGSDDTIQVIVTISHGDGRHLRSRLVRGLNHCDYVVGTIGHISMLRIRRYSDEIGRNSDRNGVSNPVVPRIDLY